MTGSSHPKFRLLIGWCCLMSAALLVITVFLAAKSFNEKKHNTNTTGKESRQEEFVNSYSELLIGSLAAQPFRNYIHLIRDQEVWICNPPCGKRALSLQNNTVEIKVSGLYYTNAQVYFQKAIQTNDQSKPGMRKQNVILVRNEGNGKREKKLSEVIHYEEGSVSLSRVVRLMRGDRISLNIIQQSMLVSTEDEHTYWEIILLNSP